MESENSKIMTFETFSYIKSLLEKEKVSLESLYRNALYMIGDGRETDIARKNAYRNFTVRYKNLENMLEQLRYAAGMSHGPNIGEKMKEFWGLE